MDPIKPLVRYVTYDFYQRHDGFRPHRYRKLLAQTQHYSSDEIAALQLAKLKNILQTAFETNAFYRGRFLECGFRPGDVRDFSDLKALPLLTKDDIRTELVRTFSKGYSPETTVPRRTGGSTGTPLLVYHDYDAASAKRAAAERHNSWANWNVGDRVACVWGDTRGFSSRKFRLRNALSTRATYLDTLQFDPSHIDDFLSRLSRVRPKVLFGHAHSLYRLGEYVNGRWDKRIGVQSVVTSSMVLSPAERQTIEEVFQVPVYNRYGCHETSLIASECSAHSGLHIFAEGLYVELLGDREDVPRKIVLTDLLNRAMPLIRYEVGDCGEYAGDTCPCGRALPRLKEISGRTADFLYTPDGALVFGISILDTFVIHIPGIKQLQIIQDQYDHLELHLVRDGSFSEDTLALLRWKVREVFGDRMRYDVQFADQIPPTRSGKYRFSICKIPGVGSERALS